MYKGHLKGFPSEIVEKMMERQEEQGNSKNYTVFEKRRGVDSSQGGFTWHRTREYLENTEFWAEVLNRRNFKLFYEMYPKSTFSVKDIYSEFENKK